MGNKDCCSRINNMLFPIKDIERIVIDYFKMKIISYDYGKNAPSENPYISPIGLDVTSYYSHPADADIPGRTRTLKRDELFEMDSAAYNDMYCPYQEDQEGQLYLGDFGRF